MAETEQNAITRWMDGKKTYFTAAAILVVGILSYFGVAVPDFVWAALGAVGLGFLRAGVSKAGQEGGSK